MNNMKKIKGTFKGVIGEYLFKMINDNAILTRFFSKTAFFDRFKNKFNEEQKDFLKKNWYSIDLVEPAGESGKPVVYEVKTKSDYREYMAFKSKITAHQIDVYEEAKRRGFIVKTAFVILENNWNYKIKISNFDTKQFSVNKPKKYDFLNQDI